MSPDRIEALLPRFGGSRVAIVGDLMLDEFIWGDVARISPDAPVQVVEVRRTSHAIGGAGNVANAVIAAGGSASLFGVVGDDAPGTLLTGLLRDAGLAEPGIVVEKGRPTTQKTRVIARGQHLVRLDHEVRTPPAATVRDRLLARLSKVLPTCGAVLVSDYAKGIVDAGLVAEIARLAAKARRRGPAIPILVDPKVADVSRYVGCHALTPNLREAEAAARMTIATDDDLAEAARRIRLESAASWVLITRGDKGMALSDPEGGLHLIPARAREVYDVTGAGDIVMAYFGLGLAGGIDPLDAATVANLAAGVGVGKVGTASVAPHEILAAELGHRSGAKIVDLAGASSRAGRERSLGRKVVFTNGCFDLLHAGHVHLLERARALGDVLVVAVNSDASVHRLKGAGRPVLSQDDRVKILSALDAVDLVVIFDDDTPLEAIRGIRPDVLVKGGDYAKETIVGHDLVEGYGGRVETIPLVRGRSTSGLIADITKLDRTKKVASSLRSVRSRRGRARKSS